MMNNLHEMQVSSQGKTAAQPQEGPESRKAFIGSKGLLRWVHG